MALEIAPPEEKPDGFDTARFFDTGDPVSLSHDNPDAAIYDWIDSDVWYEKGKDEPFVDALKRCCPVVVMAYSPEPPTDREIERWGETLAESWLEYFGEEYGDPENDASPEDNAKVEAIFKAASQEAAKHIHVWRCAEVGKREYTFEEVLELVKKDLPELLEEDED